VGASKVTAKDAPLPPKAADTTCGAGNGSLAPIIDTVVEAAVYSVLPPIPRVMMTSPDMRVDAVR
jgi:hypothetical protein